VFMNKIFQKDYLALFIFLVVLLLNFSPVKPLSYPLTLAPFAIMYLLTKFSDISKLSNFQAIALITVPSYVILISFFDLAFGEVDFFVYLRTYFLWLFYFICFVTCFCDIKNEYKSGLINSLQESCAKSLIALCFFVILQVSYYKMTGDVSIFSLWGDFSYGAQGYTLKAIELGATKANGLYLEPSTLGMVCFCLLSVVVILGAKLLYIIPAIVIVLLSGSAAGMGAVIILLIVLSFKQNELPHKWKRIKFINRIGMLSSLVFLLLVMGPYLIGRIGDVLIEGTSTYYRLIAPVQVIYDIFLDYPFGITFGMVEITLIEYGMLNGLNQGTSLDNGWYLLMFYFGWVGFIMFLLCTSGALWACIKGSKELGMLAVYLMLSPFFTGAVFSPEFLFLQMLVLFAYKLKVQHES
jgi:putative colanic acid polymerase